jgi:hypothetical protein
MLFKGGFRSAESAHFHKVFVHGVFIFFTSCQEKQNT